MAKYVDLNQVGNSDNATYSVRQIVKELELTVYSCRKNDVCKPGKDYKVIIYLRFIDLFECEI